MGVSGEPGGTPYDWYARGSAFLDQGNPEAAIVLLEWVLAEDQSAAVLEAYGRALFDARRYSEAIDVLTRLVERWPDADYGHYALGLSLWRMQRFLGARDHLAMAFVMRPDRADYGKALAQVKATLRARIEGGLPLEGPLETDQAS